MARATEAPPGGAPRPPDDLRLPILLFDGNCRFCTGCVDWLERRLVRRTRLLPWQEADLAALGVTREEARRAVWWIEPSGRTAGAARAVAAALQACRRPWPLLGAFLDLPGVRWLAAIGYRAVARSRHRLPGPVAACKRGGARVAAPTRDPG